MASKHHYRRPWVQRDPRQANVKTTRPAPGHPPDDKIRRRSVFFDVFLDWLLVILCVAATVYLFWR